ncbi:lysozyme inhibitor LprI family protein [Pseudomonas jinjuensis]|uniref:lysozyme inhibitor LprI family protein n=1 Tax=Pseudomonas jinjuensis TaxID=198616 RepID=UPI000A01749E
MEKAYATNPKLQDKLKSKIKKSQLLWIKQRDANCEIETFTMETKAQAFETTKNNCSARETEERAKYLSNLMNHTL